MNSISVSKIDRDTIKKNMNIIAVILLNTIFAFNGFICNKATDERKNDPLPDSRPEKFSISYSLSGGMRYYSQGMYISQDSCTYEINDGGAISKIRFTMTGDELDKLYKIFIDNKFHKIKTREEMIYDRGGESISLSWGNGKYANISNSGMSLIEDSWQTEWAACLNALTDLAKQEIDKQKKEYGVKFDKSFTGKKINLSTENMTYMSGDAPVEGILDYKSVPLKLLPGSHYLQLSWDQKHYERIAVNTDSTKGVILSLEKDQLVKTYIK